jgi:hypothetical protein
MKRQERFGGERDFSSDGYGLQIGEPGAKEIEGSAEG